jgi:hypothetical protein
MLYNYTNITNHTLPSTTDAKEDISFTSILKNIATPIISSVIVAMLLFFARLSYKKCKKGNEDPNQDNNIRLLNIKDITEENGVPKEPTECDKNMSVDLVDAGKKNTSKGGDGVLLTTTQEPPETLTTQATSYQDNNNKVNNGTKTPSISCGAI